MDHIGKQLTCQKFIFKIHSSRLRRENWKLSLTVDEARKNDEVISLADSQILRWIDEINGITDADAKAKEIKMSIRAMKRDSSTQQSRRAIRQLYRDLDAIQFKPDYMCLIIDKPKDYYRACKGFTINGIKYHRLLGTNGGIKNSTIVFVSEKLYPELNRRIENGRDAEKPLVTAKLEAYRALTCSASIPVSIPNGILIVNDAETEFDSDILYLTDEGSGEPKMELRTKEHLKVDVSDGFGLMMPSLAEKWSDELGLDYTVSGVNTRFSFEKGMVFTFDFIDFADKVARSYYVTDAWGNTVDIRGVELILTTSMVKLWDSYKSCEDYVNTSISNGYTFGVSKSCPKELENERALNYQFIQSYDLSDDDIDELIAPTMNEILDVLGGDWRKTVLFLKGQSVTQNNIYALDDDYIKAIMIDKRVLDDPFVQKSIYQLIKNRINEAKVGVINVHGNYSIVSGDPYTLCQSIFGLVPTGLLRSGEIYNEYWANTGAESLACFRAPMTCHNNIRLVHPVRSDSARYWYRYMNTATVFNSWDTAAMALNGCDFDGDLVMLTDNRVLVDNLNPLPALMCAQRKAQKVIPCDEDFIKSNIESFGNDIGKTTNWVTSMFEVRSRFPKYSEEYGILTYRIQCGQLYQQNAIDKAKGIVCKPMPRQWHDRRSLSSIEDETGKKLYQRIVADKKPYFMRYIYPALMKQYNTYIKNTNRNALREFDMTVDDLLAINEDDMTERQREFIRYYYLYMPVGISDCVMNKVCRKFETMFDGYVGRYSASASFDYKFMRTDVDYTPRQFKEVKRLFDEYNRRLKSYAVFADYERIDEYDSMAAFSMMNDDFRRQCSIACPNEDALCNIVLDICYSKSSTKRFAWNMCGATIINNLLSANDNTISYMAKCDDGDILYGGNRFKVETMRMGA